MSEHKVQGGDMLLFIDPNGGQNYDTVVCLTSVGVSDSVSVVDASSACGPDKSPGTVEMSYSFEGQHIQDPNGGDISGTDLRILLRAEQTIGWKLSPLNPQPGDEIQEGTGYLSELSSTYAFDSVGTFTGTLQPYGMPTITVYNGGFFIGQAYGGGYIAYIDNSGQHGLIINGPTPLANNIWSNETTYMATSNNYGDGATNTLNIVLNLTGSAAYVAYSHNGGGFTDWFLPNGTELSACSPYLNFNPYEIWTSFDVDANNAFSYDYGFSATGLKSLSKSVFATRYF
jgi:hypothetical protein